MKRIFALFILAAFLLSTVSCRTMGPGREEKEEAETGSTKETGTGEKGPVVLTDQAGRSVTIEKTPERIVSGYTISSSALIALGLREKLVGIEAKAAKRAIYQRSAPELAELPGVGSAKEPDLEACISCEPDLVILPKKLEKEADILAGLGIPVLLVNPEDQTLLREMITLLSTACGVDERGEELLRHVDGIEAGLRDKLSGCDAPVVYFAGNSSFLSTAGKNMYQADLLALAGGQNAAEEISDTYWASVSYEQILLWDPEVILIASDADYSEEEVLKDPGLQGVRAVKEKRVYKLPGDAENWDTPVPGGILGAVWTASRLHPDRVTEEEALKCADEYYEKFYGFTYSK